MNSMEFGMLCKPLNLAYRDLFGSIPVPSEYACSREEFLEAIKKSVDEHQPIETYLKKRAVHHDGRME